MGTVWILDGLEVTIVGALGDRLTQADSGLVKNYYLGALLMIVAGLAEIVFGVKAARKSLEQVAQPLSVVADDVKRLGLNG